jgi:hypothetical protein
VATYRYEVVREAPTGPKRPHEYAADEPLEPGSVVFVEGRFWLVERIEPSGDDGPATTYAKPARYQLRLQHPDGREELGALRRFRPDAPRYGHSFTTLERGRPVSWEVVEERLMQDDDGEPYLDLLARRDFAEHDGDVPDHELEHALGGQEAQIPKEAVALLARAADEGLEVELVALEPGEEPSWAEADRFVDSLILEEVPDDLLELCGVHPDDDPREAWLGIVKERLRSDLAAFREDIESDHDEIEEWDFLGGRVLASIGSYEDESDPNNGHGWMCRLVDASALAAAGFERVRKAELDAVG